MVDLDSVGQSSEESSPNNVRKRKKKETGKNAGLNQFRKDVAERINNMLHFGNEWEDFRYELRQRQLEK